MASVEKIAIPNKRFIGDVVNGLVIVNTLVYIGFIVSHAYGFGVEFSPSFAQDGFCVSNKAIGLIYNWTNKDKKTKATLTTFDLMKKKSIILKPQPHLKN